jgi:hypothetical protein
MYPNPVPFRTISGKASFLWRAFDDSIATRRRRCRLESNMSKLKALSPIHGVSRVPEFILEAQKGTIHGFKCAGGFVGPRTASGDAYRTANYTTILEKIGDKEIGEEARAARHHPHHVGSSSGD